jgi:hypothetical protein
VVIPIANHKPSMKVMLKGHDITLGEELLHNSINRVGESDMLLLYTTFSNSLDTLSSIRYPSQREIPTNRSYAYIFHHKMDWRGFGS